jgi:hypothetical protein
MQLAFQFEPTMSTLTAWLSGGFMRGRQRQRATEQPNRAVQASSTTQTLTERRQSQRRWGDPVQVHLWDGYPGSEPGRGWIANRSAGGLGLSVPEPLIEGTILNVRVAMATETVPWVPVVVKHHHSLAGRHVLNCQFLRTPEREVLLMFR